jgi:membrane protein implicated in regulation of membrane protease activity
MALAVAILLAVFVLDAPWSFLAVGAGAAVELAESGFLIRWSRRRQAVVGAEALVGREALVIDERHVRIDGEGLEGRLPGDAVTVIAVDGLTLVVS